MSGLQASSLVLSFDVSRALRLRDSWSSEGEGTPSRTCSGNYASDLLAARTDSSLVMPWQPRTLPGIAGLNPQVSSILFGDLAGFNMQLN